MHPLRGGILRNVRQLDLVGILAAGDRRHTEHIQLSLYILPPGAADGVQHHLIHGDELGAPVPQTVEGAAADEILHGALVHIAAVIHPLAEVLEGLEQSPLLPLLHHRQDEAPSDVLDGHQTEPDTLRLHGEPIVGAVHIRRQQRDAAVTAFSDVPRYLVGVVQHAGQQRRHVLLGVVALEIRRLIGHHRIADGVCLVEGVVGKVEYLVVNGLRRGLTDAVCNTAGDAPLLVAVDESLPLLFDLLGLLLADGPAHHVRLPQREAAQLLKNADDLLLIHDTPVGHRQNGDELGVLVRHQLWVVLTGDKPRDRFHRPRPV